MTIRPYAEGHGVRAGKGPQSGCTEGNGFGIDVVVSSTEALSRPSIKSAAKRPQEVVPLAVSVSAPLKNGNSPPKSAGALKRPISEELQF